MKPNFQPFPNIVHDVSEILCVILYTKEAFAQLNEMRSFYCIQCNINIMQSVLRPPLHWLKYIWKIFCASVDESLVPNIAFSMMSILYHIWKACINLMTFEKYLQHVERTQTVWQTDRQTNQMHKHCLTLLESVINIKNKKRTFQLKILCQLFLEIENNVSAISCEILCMKS